MAKHELFGKHLGEAYRSLFKQRAIGEAIRSGGMSLLFPKNQVKSEQEIFLDKINLLNPKYELAIEAIKLELKNKHPNWALIAQTFATLELAESRNK